MIMSNLQPCKQMSPCFCNRGIPFHNPLAYPFYHQQTSLQSAPNLQPPTRPKLLYFGGNIGESDPLYSGGVRQAFYEAYVKQSQPPDVLYQSGGFDLPYLEATFCLSPTGYGFGARISDIISFACIPVTIQVKGALRV